MKVAILHYLPLEKYPPIVNLLNYIEEREDGHLQCKVWTTKQEGDSFYPATIKVVKLPGLKPKDNKIRRILDYLNFNFKVLFHLIAYKPKKILYYESISALPALLYKVIWDRNVKVLVHYHEYTSPEEYQNGMVSTRIIHKLEQRNYKLYNWISHTNQTRADLFSKDNAENNVPVVHILPNYPPKNWSNHRQVERDYSARLSGPIKLVYVGALCTETMYTKEICNWVNNQDGEVTLDLWSTNISDNAKKYFEKNHSKWVSLKGGVNYNQLPFVLSNYDIGIILYKGHIPNYVYNAPNKLFEYLVCGLDVWFPEELKGTYPYICENNKPTVLKIDFANLNSLTLNTAANIYSLERRALQFVAEEAYKPLVDFIQNHS